MSRTVFESQRCKKCQSLMLKSEKHVCQKLSEYQKRDKRNIVSEIKRAFENLDEPSLRPSQISHFINKACGWPKYTQFEIRHHLEKSSQKYKVDHSRKDRYEKYYFHDNMDNHPIESDLKPKTEYYIKPPSSKYGLTHSIKRITVTGATRTEKTLAMVYGEGLAESLLEKCRELKA